MYLLTAALKLFYLLHQTENYSIATFCFRIESSQVEEELRNTLAAIPLMPSHTKTWSDRKEQVELSWGNHHPGIFEDMVSSMAMPSGAVCTVYAYVSIYQELIMRIGRVSNAQYACVK